MKIALTTFLTLLFAGILFAQDEKIGLDITLTYTRSADGSVTLQAEVYDEEEYEPVTDLEFQFISVAGEEEEVLGAAYSDENAMVVLSGIPFEKILRDMSDNMVFRLVGENDIYSGFSELQIRHVELSVNFKIEDSVKIVSVDLTGKDEDGETVGVEDGEVYFFVPRLYGDLAIGDVWTDEDGYDQMRFPTDIPGDESGNLTVIARITESEDFGSLEVRVVKDWGLPTMTEALDERELWSPNAPLWMVITFAILITGVFVHYIWVIVNLYRVKKLGR